MTINEPAIHADYLDDAIAIIRATVEDDSADRDLTQGRTAETISAVLNRLLEHEPGSPENFTAQDALTVASNLTLALAEVGATFLTLRQPPRPDTPKMREARMQELELVHRVTVLARTAPTT
jgi:hypothetical protein